MTIYSIIQINSPFRCIDYFQFSAVINNATINIIVGKPLFTPLIIFLVQMPRNGITELKAIPNAKVFDIIYHIALHKIIKNSIHTSIV